MREIKFRGKRVDTGEWVYGDILANNGSPIIVAQVKRDYILKIYTNGGDHWAIETPAYRVIPETIGQYTGLKDKNDKGIWEGDIISDTSWGVPCKSYIFYNQDICAFQTRYHNINGQLVSNTIYSIDKKKFQVIGDIHNNPELLIP